MYLSKGTKGNINSMTDKMKIKKEKKNRTFVLEFKDSRTDKRLFKTKCLKS